MNLQTSIYDNSLYFAITFDGHTDYILEPKGWDNIQNRIPRDPNYFGFWSDFLEEKYPLLFTFIIDESLGLTGGAQILKDIYETKGEGAEAEVYFSFGVKNYNTYEEYNSWRINLNEYNCDFGGVDTSIEKMPFQGKLRARMTSPCTINEYRNMDGEVLSKIPTQQLRLHGKTLLLTSQAISSSPQSLPESISTFFDTYLVVQPDQSNLIINELPEIFSQTAGILDTTSRNPSSSGTPQPANGSGLDNEPFQSTISQFTPKYSGFLDIAWSGGSSNCSWYYYKTGTPTTGNNYWDVTPRVVVQRMISGIWTVINEYDGTTKTISALSQTGVSPTSPMIGNYPFSIATAGQSYLLPSVTGSTPRSNVTQVIGYEFSELWTNIPVQSGDNIYVQLILCPNGTTKTANSSWIQLDNFTNNIKYTELTTAPGSTCNAYRIFDVVTQMLENLTGQKNALISNFFSEDGAGYNFLITNGYSIRNYLADMYLLKKDLESTLNDLLSTFCLAIGIKRFPDGTEKLVIEYISDFFKNRTIRRYDDTFNWKTKNTQKFRYNKADIGYSKHEGLNIIQQDEFNTEGSYLLQYLKYNNNTLSKKTAMIASGYLIEEQRRNQFSANPGQSLTNDNDCFIISISNPNIFKIDFPSRTPTALILTNSTSTVGFPFTSMALMAGDKFTTSTGTNAGTVFTIVSEFPGYPIIGLDVYYITPAPITEIIGVVDVEIFPPSPNQLFSERNQPFEICSGCIDPSTIYNGRISLSHILDNWRPVLGVGLSSVDENSIDFSQSQIIPTLIKMNSLFTTKFFSSETFKGNTGDKIHVEIARQSIKDYLKNGSNIFSPTGASCEIRVGWNDIDVIRRALSGETGIDTYDYGGLELKDDFGIFWFCHVMDMTYDLKKEILKLEVQKVYQVI